ncbi:immunoglobulin lambda-1 light chain-like [Hemitrygon akajei]|uniref:immunoglobulin lambda-1 light chain-like n=1 Tax=Hemitrygon akajei TaxID=2704970 RepID=UPI003BF9FB7C
MSSSGFITFFTMCKRLGVVFLIVLLVSESKAQVILSQPPSVSTESGRNVEIYCTVKGVGMGNAVITWYQQKTENAPPRYLLRHDSQDLVRASGTPDRFSGRSSSSLNSRYLTITGVQKEDQANYYCGVWVTSSNTYIFGTGTKLTLSSQGLSSPKVSLLLPASDQITKGKMATLVCLVDNFYPEGVEVSWSTDGTVVNAGVKTSRAVQGSDRTYSLSSYLTLTAMEWNSHEVYTCGVTHASLVSQLKQSIRRSECTPS